MAAVGEDRELDPSRAPVVEEGVDRGPDRAPGEEDVVDEHDRPALEVEVEVRGMDDRGAGGLAAGQIVAIEGDVDVAERDLRVGELVEQVVEATGDQGAARVDADDRQLGIGIVAADPVSGLGSGVLLDDLVRDAHQRPA